MGVGRGVVLGLVSLAVIGPMVWSENEKQRASAGPTPAPDPVAQPHEPTRLTQLLESRATTAQPISTTPISHGGYGSVAAADTDGLSERELEEAQEARERADLARTAVRDAQYDLNRSVRRLDGGDWQNDLPRVQRNLRNLEDAADELERADPGSYAASNLSYEARKMKRELRDLETENWQTVVPEIERRNKKISWETDAVESEADSDY